MKEVSTTGVGHITHYLITA